MSPHDLRTGFGLSTLVQQRLGNNPFSGQLLLFRGRCGDLVKILSPAGAPSTIASIRRPIGGLPLPLLRSVSAAPKHTSG